jgi:hypothetical protein
MLDIDEVLERKNELEDIINDIDEQYTADEQADAQEELDEIENFEIELGMDLTIASQNGVYFIAEHDFTQYAEELANDIGAIGVNSYEWPINHIDWDSAAEELKMDYSEVEWQGTTYLFSY